MTCKFMKQNTIIILFLLSIISACTKQNSTVMGELKKSIGARNEVVVVIDDSLWFGAVGDSIRGKLAHRIEGLSGNEPVFDLVQFDPSIFSIKAKTARNIVQFTSYASNEFVLEKSLNASPQNFFFIRGKSIDDLLAVFKANADSIVSVFKASELNEETHDMVRSSRKDISELKDYFGCVLKIPSTYHLQVKKEYPFLWYQKALSSGNLNLVLYEFPISEIEDSKQTINQRLLMARDYIGKEFLKTAKDSAYITTNPDFVPLITKETVQDLPAYKIIGTYTSVNDFIKGPFITYAIRDEYYQRYLFLDGFINSPLRNKREQLLELEAIIKTVNFNEGTN